MLFTPVEANKLAEENCLDVQNDEVERVVDSLLRDRASEGQKGPHGISTNAVEKMIRLNRSAAGDKRSFFTSGHEIKNIIYEIYSGVWQLKFSGDYSDIRVVFQ